MKFDNRIYGYNWKKITAWQVPVRLRQFTLMAIAESFISAITVIYARFANFKLDVEYRLTITPQVCFLQKLVNDRFDYTLRRITIDDGVMHDPALISLQAEAKPMRIGLSAEGRAALIPTKGEVAQFQSDFVINIPQEVKYNESELRALVNQYKLAGKVFTINKVL